MKRFSKVARGALIVLAASSSHTALAQSEQASAQSAPPAANPPQSGTAPVTPPAAASSGVEDIVVTAQKRSERLQDVPVAVSALSAAAVTSKGIRTGDDLAIAVPSLTWGKNLNGAPYIRGVGTRITTAGNVSSVAIFVDGVLQISPLQANFSLNNIDRVEVLKGPQGTLFGRNANGGVISIVTHDPDKEAKFDGSVGYANYNTVDAQFYAQTGLGENLSANLSVNYHNQMDGWGRNIALNRDAYRERMFDIRSKLRWQDDRTDIILAGEYHYLWSDINANSIAAGTLGVDGSSSPGFYNLNEDFYSYSRSRIYGGSLKITHDFDWAKLVSISAYTRVRTIWPFDTDSTPANALEGPIHERASGGTQELQLVSPSAGRFRWIVGAYFLDTVAAFYPIRLFGSEVGNAMVDVYGRTKAKSEALFGQATWEFARDTHLIVGGRMTWDQREVDGHTDVNLAPGAVTKQSKSFSQPTYRVTLDHKFQQGLMAYATVSTGYNSGQFNTGNAAAPAVKPEKLQAYEVGIKSEFFDRMLQLNAAAYYYDYKDLQVTISQNAVTLQTNAARAHIKGIEADAVFVPKHGLTFNFSAAYTDAKYAKYQNAQFYVPAQTVTPGAAGGYAQVVGDASGNQLVLSPKWSITAGATYDIDIGNGWLTPGVNWNHKSKFYWDYQQYFTEPSHDLVNASLTFSPPSRRWSIAVWGKNLTNEKIRAAGLLRNEGAMSAPAAPITYGGTFTVHM